MVCGDHAKEVYFLRQPVHQQNGVLIDLYKISSSQYVRGVTNTQKYQRDTRDPE
jgi:hypothetical protein